MTAKLGVLVIHGIGNQPSDYAQEFHDNLIGEVAERRHSANEICVRPVHWAPILQRKEDALLERLNHGGSLEWNTLRQFVVHGFADALAYQPAPEAHTRWDIYHMIHREIAREVRALRAELRSGRAAATPDPPVVIIAHSLGCHMISNFIWDARRQTDVSPFERMESVAGIVFMVCNIPLFSLAHKRFKPIAFPHPNLAQHFPTADAAQVRRAARWLNLYDPDDVLGWPLATSSADYASSAVEDIEVDVGGLLSSWNPMSHTRYWGDDSVVTRVAGLAEELLHLL